MPHEASPILCYVTERHALAAGDRAVSELLEKIRSATQAGVGWVQIREKDLSACELLELARRAIAASGSPTRILIHDRLDIALAAGAAGVHLGGESAPVADVARWCRAGHAPAGFLIGASCHQPEEAVAAQRDGADYIFLGPIFATPSKAAFGPPQGLDRLADVCRRVQIPVMAIGGINAKNAGQCLNAGAAGIAAIRLFQQAASTAALAEIVSRLHRRS